MFLIIFITKSYSHSFHCFQNDSHRLYRIRKDYFFKGFSFFWRISSVMNKLHLLKNRRFTGFTSTYLKKVLLTIITIMIFMYALLRIPFMKYMKYIIRILLTSMCGLI